MRREGRRGIVRCALRLIFGIGGGSRVCDLEYRRIDEVICSRCRERWSNFLRSMLFSSVFFSAGLLFVTGFVDGGVVDSQ